MVCSGSAFALTLTLSFVTVLRAQGDHGLVVRPDPRNAVAQALVGVWTPESAVNARLGSAASKRRFEFREDADVVGKVPTAIAAKLRDVPILQQGTMVMDGAPHPYLLIVRNGNPIILWFRERDGDPMGDTEAFLVAIARAKDAAGDLLLLGGDRAEQAMVAYAREAKDAAGLAPEATVALMIQMLEAKRARQFVETFCAPADLVKMREAGRSVDDLAKRFEGERAQYLLEMLQQVSKLPAQWNEARDEVAWDNPGVEHAPKRLRLRRIDGRWYIADR